MRKTHGIGIAPPPDIVAAVVKVFDEADTEGQAAERLGVSVATLIRLRTGLTVRAGTIALVRERLGREAS